MRILTKSVVGLGMVALMVSTGAAAAQADDLDPSGSTSLLSGDSVTAPLDDQTPVPSSSTGEDAGASGMLRASATSPAGCTGNTDYPHKSGNDVSVHANMKCRATVTRLEVLTVVYRERWYGWETFNTGSATRNGASAVEATPHKSCKGTGTFSYKAVSAHASLENGVVYRSSTTNWQIPGVSRFAC